MFFLIVLLLILYFYIILLPTSFFFRLFLNKLSFPPCVKVISDMEASKYQLAEWRVSIYGRKLSEWDKLSRWFYAHRLAHPCVRWLIQIPRLFHLYAKSGEVTNFQDMLDNIFAPMFEVTVDPSSNVELHVFLSTVVGFDCVDDESNELPESFHDSVPPLPPSEWKGPSNPPYSMWMYYLYANLAHLNHLRAEVMHALIANTFSLPSAHLLTCFFMNTFCAVLSYCALSPCAHTFIIPNFRCIIRHLSFEPLSAA